MSLLKNIKKIFSAPKPSPLKSVVQWAGKSDVGKVRTNNEDFWLAEPEIGLWVVCDGMGGHHAGEYASELAAKTLLKKVKEGFSLKDVIPIAHEAVCQLGQNPEKGKLPGTTVAALQVKKKQWHLAWVGDSRCWLLQQGQLNQLSHDHTVVQQLVDWGDITPEEAQNHPDRNRLSQAVGQEGKPPIVGKADGTLQAGMTFLLATDGMAHWNEPDTLAEVLAADDLQVVVNQLVADSLEAGGHDNVTCVVVRA